MTYDFVFFLWFRGEIMMVEDYAYAWNDFRGDPNLPLLEYYQWDNKGKKDDILHYVFYFYFLIYFIFVLFLRY